MNILQLLSDAATTKPPLEPIPFYANPQNMIMILVFGMIIFFLLTSSKTKKTEQRQRDDMLKNLKRGDRVMTAGGILGNVVDVRDTDVVLKVDESTNTKIKFTREAIKRVVTDDEFSAGGAK